MTKYGLVSFGGKWYHAGMITFTMPHWQTLAVFEVIPEPLTMEILETLSPLHHLDLTELLRAAVSLGLVREAGEGRHALSDHIPSQALNRLRRINIQKHAARLVMQMNRRGLMDSLTIPGRMALLLRAGFDYEAALLAEEAARKSVLSGDRPTAIGLLKTGLQVITGHLGSIEWDTLFLGVINELIRVMINIADSLQEIPSLLSRARKVAERIGDRRTLARCDLVMGLYMYVIGTTAEGLSLISSGLQQAEAIGDEEIMAITAEFRGIYYYLRGMYKEAVDAFDLVVRRDAMQTAKIVPTFLPEHLASSSALGYVSALLGQYHRAIGVLDSLWRRTRMNTNDRNACFYEALLGIVLIITGRKSEAHSHLKAAQK
ncbi:hypothetical protein EG829_27805, partial [bacterium]|nr:hypothetical protein [bacterium]